MRYLNQLEPDALLDRFAAHPPLNFRLEMVADVPVFLASFDLLTTTEAPIRARLQRAPGYRWWSRLLHWRTAFIGTTVSEYVLFPSQVDPRALPQQLIAALGHRQRMMVVKDLPQASPLLDNVSQRWSEDFLQASVEAGYVMLAGQALAYVPIDFADEQAYLSRLSASRRKDIRRKLRRRDALAVEVLRCGDARFADEVEIDRYYALYEAVYAQSDIHFDKLSREFFAALLRDGDSGGIVFVYRHDTAMIGWNLCFVVDGKLIDKYIGFAYPQARENNLYFISWFQNLAYAREHDLSHYVAGWTDPEIKSYLGASFTLTRHAVYLRSPLLRLLARRLGKFFESESRWG
ncbi:MAG: GNAT family N-acetyltransferase [Dyella sp.]